MTTPSSRARMVVVALGLVASGGCSLVTLKVPGEPLPRHDLQARLMTRDMASVFADRVEQAADRISAATGDDGVRSAALRWKIAAIAACRKAALRQDPRQALVDVWALCVQQRDFLTRGAGSALFGPAQPEAVNASDRLIADVVEVADETMAPAVRATMADVVARYAATYPITSLGFDREPILPLWQAAAADSARVTTVGSTPEVVEDIAGSLRILGEQVPDALRWRTELALTEREKDIAELRALLERLDAGLTAIDTLAQKSPELAAAAARELQRELGPSLARLDSRWGESLSTLVAQREAMARDLETMQANLAATVKSEREAMTTTLDAQRAALMTEVGGIAASTTDRALTRVRVIAREVMLLLILLAAVVLGLPFGAGYLVGRSRAKAATS